MISYLLRHVGPCPKHFVERLVHSHALPRRGEMVRYGSRDYWVSYVIHEADKDQRILVYVSMHPVSH